ncbi:MAG: response regulator [Methylococcales bacterium]|nr:response regulator [Methylococcales bacterium]
MAAVILLNLPLVEDQFESFTHQYQLQRLRVDFSDLEKHIASRKELVRLLAKVSLPEDITVEKNNNKSTLWFTQWINQLLRSSFDIYEVLYIDKNGKKQFHLIRESTGTPLEPSIEQADFSKNSYYKSGISMPFEEVLVSPINIDRQQLDPYHFMTMSMLSPIISFDGSTEGVVLIKLDVSALPNLHPNTIWVHHNGHYLQIPGQVQTSLTAFNAYPGIQEQFQYKKFFLWKNKKDEQIIWVPIFLTENKGPLWVGRLVDPSNLDTFIQSLQQRVMVIVLILMFSVLFIANGLATIADRSGKALILGIEKVLNSEKNILFSWRGPQEIKKLSKDLTRLAYKQSEMTQSLIERAKELEDSNRYKSQFLANMSHELRTPLNSIILLSKLLSENDKNNLTNEQIKQSCVIYQAGSNLLMMINDILDISKIEAKQTTYQISEFKPAELLLPLQELFEPLTQQKKLDFKFIQDLSLEEKISGDKEKILQILKNFISNAIKFTEQGSITFYLQSNEGEDKNRPIKICIVDTGIGIPIEKQDVIFEAFKQADGSTSRKYGGTGLGLAISYEMAKSMGCKVTVNSVINQGSTFCLAIPVVFDIGDIDEELISYENQLSATIEVMPDYEMNEVALPVQSVLSKINHLKTRSILLIESNLMNLLKLNTLLENLSFEITGAGSVQELSEIFLHKADFDCIFINRENDFSSAEVVSIIGSSANLPIPIIVAGKNDLNLAGYQVFEIALPLDTEVFLEALNDVFKG